MSKYIELLVRMDEEGKTSKESKLAKVLAEKALDREDYVDAYLMGFNSTEVLSGGTTELSRQGLFEELSKKTDNHKAKNKQKRTEVQNRINHYFGVERVEKKKDPSTISLILGDVTPVVQYNWYLDNGGRYEWLENDYTPTSKYQTEFDFIEKYGSGKKFKAGRTDKEIRAIRTSFNRNRNDWVKWDIYHGVPKEETFKKRKVREVTYDTILDDCKAEFHNMTLLYAGSINMKQIIKYKLGMTELFTNHGSRLMAKDFSLLGFLYSKGVSMSDLVLIYNESPFLIKSEVSKQRCELRNTSLTLETVLSNLEPQERLQVQNLITSCHTEVPTGLNVVFNLVTLKDAFESCSKEQKLASLLNLTTYAKENFKVEFDQWSGISLESSDLEKLKSIVKLGIKGVTWKLTYTVKLERTLLDSDFSRIKKTLHDVKATNVNDLGKLVWEWSNKNTN